MCWSALGYAAVLDFGVFRLWDLQGANSRLLQDLSIWSVRALTASRQKQSFCCSPSCAVHARCGASNGRWRTFEGVMLFAFCQLLQT